MVFSEDVLNAHTDRETVRTLEKILRSKSSGKIDPNQLKPGTNELAFHESSRHNEPN